MSSLLVLGFFMIVVGIPVIGGLIFAFQERKLKLREKEMEILGGRAMQEASEQAARIEWLEERMRVVEQIVTDKGLSLSEEIERLRDRPRHEIGNRRSD